MLLHEYILVEISDRMVNLQLDCHLRQTKNHGKNPFENVHAASFRMIVDFSDLESSLFIISTGQSGHLLSNQYDNLANLWKRGEYIPMVLDPKLARAGSLGSVLLKRK